MITTQNEIKTTERNEMIGTKKTKQTFKRTLKIKYKYKNETKNERTEE